MAPEKRAVEVTIRIDKGHAGPFDDVVRALKAAGLRSVEAHERLGMVNGAIAADGLDDLRGVSGVASVREDKTYRPQ
jgi:hypothetical protein